MIGKIFLTLSFLSVLDRSFCIKEFIKPSYWDYLSDVSKEDAIISAVNPIGLRLYTEIAPDHLAACKEYVDMLKSPKTFVKLVTPIVTLTQFHSMIGKYIQRIVKDNKDTLCYTVKNYPARYTEFAKAFNKEFEKHKVIRKNYMNAMSSAIEVNTKINSNTVGCFLNKWAEETIAAISTDTAKEFMASRLKGLGELTKSLNPTTNCSLSGYKDKPYKYTSIEMLFYEAVKNTLTLEKSKAEEKERFAAELEKAKEIMKLALMTTTTEVDAATAPGP